MQNHLRSHAQICINAKKLITFARSPNGEKRQYAFVVKSAKLVATQWSCGAKIKLEKEVPIKITILCRNFSHKKLHFVIN
jgi:hypothetical protein